jgi:glutamine synthetase
MKTAAWWSFRRAMCCAAYSRYTELGLTPVVAPEMEFYLFARRQQLDAAPQAPASYGKAGDSLRQPYALDRLHDLEAVLDDIRTAASCWVSVQTRCCRK